MQKVHIVNALESGLGLGPAGLAGVESEISNTITAVKEGMETGGQVLLVLDGIDFLLAATARPALEILDLVGSLREVCLLLCIPQMSRGMSCSNSRDSASIHFS